MFYWGLCFFFLMILISWAEALFQFADVSPLLRIHTKEQRVLEMYVLLPQWWSSMKYYAFQSYTESIMYIPVI